MRRRILLLVVGMTALVVLAFAVPLALLIRHVVFQDATNEVQDKANQVANFLHFYATPTQAQIVAQLDNVTGDRVASVQLPNGTVIGQLPPGSAALPSVGRAAGPGDGDHGGPPQTAPVSWHGGKLTQLGVGQAPGQAPDNAEGGQYVVRVYASNAQLHSGETGWWWLLAGSSLGLLLVGVAGGELVTRRIVRPLTHTAQTAHRISSGDTSARAQADGPREIAEVGSALNRLADRIDELMAEERETVADLSHRLRTPLTALRLDAEALRDPAEAERVGAHVSTVERTLTAVIHAARRPQREGRLPSSDAAAVVAQRIDFWSALADDQGRASNVELPDQPLFIRASADDLAAAVDALLENVFAHTPEGTAFGVTLEATGSGARLVVRDDGTGLPADAMIRGRSDRGSSGLGLDIARRCAAAAGGSMTLGLSSSGGTVVTLEFGAP
ncbi:MAG TPA: HAMP domain-containing sensor histidine kinase [Jatrophihabitantaceae bacterium]|nr:HAMP domain-containing sensor histidine kinase [Jatrophihabitantaceae bacterium]